MTSLPSFVTAPLRPDKQETTLSYFSGSKPEREIKLAAPAKPAEIIRPAGKPDEVSTLGGGMQVTGNIVCAGALQIFGRVTGDIHASHLSIREGARVEGNVIAPDAVIEGAFNGTIHGNSVKLQKTAMVEGEIFNKSLAIEEHARFEGVSRRLERAVEPPNASQAAVHVNGVATPMLVSSQPLAATK
jgi:cytoskeletal protein CcmA (bactofilin family)